MTDIFTHTIRYLRSESSDGYEIVVPVSTHCEPNGPGGELRAVRVTELVFPVTKPDWSGEGAEDELCGAQYNTREALLLTDNLQSANEWPRNAPCLMLDAKALDEARYCIEHNSDARYATENPWVAGLYAEPELELEAA